MSRACELLACKTNTFIVSAINSRRQLIKQVWKKMKNSVNSSISIVSLPKILSNHSTQWGVTWNILRNGVRYKIKLAVAWNLLIKICLKTDTFEKWNREYLFFLDISLWRSFKFMMNSKLCSIYFKVKAVLFTCCFERSESFENIKYCKLQFS